MGGLGGQAAEVGRFDCGGWWCGMQVDGDLERVGGLEDGQEFG